MADTATDVRVVAAAEPGSLAAEANAAVRPVSMPVVDRVASGVGTAVTPIRPGSSGSTSGGRATCSSGRTS
jgi:hypothetical protein